MLEITTRSTCAVKIPPDIPYTPMSISKRGRCAMLVNLAIPAC
jgi:hypothetical protein